MKYPEKNKLDDIKDNEFKIVILKMFKEHKKNVNNDSEDNNMQTNEINTENHLSYKNNLIKRNSVGNSN